MFSYLIAALFALLSLSVSSRPLTRSHGWHTSIANATTTPSSVPSFTSPLPTLTEPTSSAPAAPTTSAVPTTSAAPTTSVPSTSSAPVSTSTALTTVSDASTAVNTGGFATYFYQNGNPGACGQVHSDSDYICAMDQTRFGTSGPDSPLCGQQVQITNVNTGQSVTVTIADDCPTCENENSIDLSVGAFQSLASLSEGIFPISWSFV